MTPELRKTGISIVGDVPWGTHFCTFYETTQDLLDLLVPFFKTGLEENEFCLWIISDSELITVSEAMDALRAAVPDLDAHLSKGGMELVDHAHWFGDRSGFDLVSVVDRFEEKLNQALAKGFAGMRVNGSPAWLHPSQDEDLSLFEEQADRLYGDLRIIASCTYPISGSTVAELLDVALAHRFVIIRRHGNWEMLETPELLQARSELRNLTEELERKVHEGTEEIAATNKALRREIVQRQQAENQVRLIIDTIPVMAWTLTPDGVVDFLNQRWLDYAGLSLEQFVADPAGPIHPEDRGRVFEKWEAQLARGEGYDDEMRLRRSDGEYRWFLVRTAPLRDERGNIVKWYGVSTDIEGRMRAREALQASEAKLKEAQQLAKIGYWERDLINDRVTLSEETSRIFSLPPGQVFTHADMRQMIHPDDRARNERAQEEALEGKRLYDIEFRMILPSAELRFIHVRDEIAYDESGHPVRMFGAVQDVTEQKQAEEAVRRSEENFRKAFESSPAPAAINRRRDRQILKVNSAYVQTFGYTEEEVIGKTPGDLGVWPDEQKRQEFWQRIQSEQSVKGHETRLRAKSGKLLDVLVYSQAIELSGEPCFLTSVVDITERKRAEEQLKRSNADLRALAARLHSVREEQSTRIARELHDELGAILTSLKWDLEGLHETPDAGDRPRLEQWKEKLEAMIRLADNAIDSVRSITSELRPIALEEFGLVEALRWHAEDFQERTGVVVNVDLQAEEISFEQEQSIAIFRIFQEAMTNVLRHAQATAVDIKLRQKDREVILSIRDNGSGITEPEKSGSQSLGLLGMRERAYLVGGEINIESGADGGTTITLRVPTGSREKQRVS